MRIAAVILVVALSTGCGPAVQEEATEPETTTELTSVTGPIIEIAPELGDVESFTVESDSGEEIEILIAPDRDYGFDLQHLHVHLDTGDPVVVGLETDADVLHATSIDDA